MSEAQVAAVIVIVLIGACGLGVVWIGRAATSRRIDWAWAGHNADNTPPQLWDEVHRQAGPPMTTSGWLLTLAGLLGGGALLLSEGWGTLVTLGLVAASMLMMVRSVAKGLRLLSSPRNE